jgi:rfaE bifunctional protein nucleotidyltransferase chain/domain
MSLTKLKSASELARIRDELEAQGRRLVFTNGCFDILHAGHVRYLQQARQLGDALLVALNGDESVRALKGPTRPLNSQDDRAEVLCALGCVDYVTIFPEVRVTHILRAVKPQIYAKGGDYTPESLNPEERDALREINAEIKILPLVPGRSTTGLITKMGPGKQEK